MDWFSKSTNLFFDEKFYISRWAQLCKSNFSMTYETSAYSWIFILIIDNLFARLILTLEINATSISIFSVNRFWQNLQFRVKAIRHKPIYIEFAPTRSPRANCDVRFRFLMLLRILQTNIVYANVNLRKTCVLDKNMSVIQISITLICHTLLLGVTVYFVHCSPCVIKNCEYVHLELNSIYT